MCVFEIKIQKNYAFFIYSYWAIFLFKNRISINDKHVFCYAKLFIKICVFWMKKISKIMRFFRWKNQHFLYKKWKIIMHFSDLCWMKNTFFIKKKCQKIALFLCVLCVFSAFLQNRKNFTSTKFFPHFHRGRL